MPSTGAWADWRETDPYVQSFPWYHAGLRNGDLRTLYHANHLNLVGEQVLTTRVIHQLIYRIENSFCVLGTQKSDSARQRLKHKYILDLLTLDTVITPHAPYDTGLVPIAVLGPLNPMDAQIIRTTEGWGKLQKLFESTLKTWYKLPQEAANCLQVMTSPPVELSQFGIIVPEKPNSAQKSIISIVKLVVNKQTRSIQAKGEKILQNLEDFMFGLRWIDFGEHVIPDDDKVFWLLLAQKAAAAKIITDVDEFRGTFAKRGDVTPQLVAAMHLALTISPLLLLAPKVLSTTTITLEKLLIVGKLIARTKPVLIRNLERKLWNAIAQMADQGLTALECLQQFTRDASDLNPYEASSRNYFPDVWATYFCSDREVFVSPTEPITPPPDANSGPPDLSHPVEPLGVSNLQPEGNTMDVDPPPGVSECPPQTPQIVQQAPELPAAVAFSAPRSPGLFLPGSSPASELPQKMQIHKSPHELPAPTHPGTSTPHDNDSTNGPGGGHHDDHSADNVPENDGPEDSDNVPENDGAEDGDGDEDEEDPPARRPNKRKFGAEDGDGDEDEEDPPARRPNKRKFGAEDGDGDEDEEDPPARRPNKRKFPHRSTSTIDHKPKKPRVVSKPVILEEGGSSDIEEIHIPHTISAREIIDLTLEPDNLDGLPLLGRTLYTRQQDDIHLTCPTTTCSQEQQIIFRASNRLDYGVMLDVAKQALAYYVDGQPRHFHESARQMEFDPENPPLSLFYIASAEYFATLSDEQVSKILKHRNILVQAPVGAKVTEFGISSLRGLRHCRDNIVIQDQSRRTEDDPNNIHVKASLLDLFLEANKEDGRPLAALDISSGSQTVFPLQFAAVSTERWAHLETIKDWGLPRGALPESDLVWNIVSTLDTFSLPHVDAAGFGTVCQLESGQKLWCAASGIKGKYAENSADAYAEPAYNPLGISPELFNMEWVLLQPNEMLIMRPNTVHTVLTPQNSITKGWHFYSAATIRQSYYGIIHTFLSGSSVTNIDHLPSRRLIRVIFASWVKWYFGSRGSDKKRRTQEAPLDSATQAIYEEFLARPTAHVPDITSMDGFLDILSAGNLVKLGGIIDLRKYGSHRRDRPDGDIPWTEVQEQTLAAKFYQDFVEGFTQEYDIITAPGAVEDTWTFAFQTSILHLCVTLVYYGYRAAPTPDMKTTLKHIPPAILRDQLTQFIGLNYPNLTASFKESAKQAYIDAGLKDKDSTLDFTRRYSLDWTGPPFTIQRKSGAVDA